MPKLGRYSSKTYILPNENYHFISHICTPSLTRMTPSSTEKCLAPTSHGSDDCTVKTDNSLTTIHGPYNCDRDCCMAQLYPAMLQKHGLCKKTIERCSLVGVVPSVGWIREFPSEQLHEVSVSYSVIQSLLERVQSTGRVDNQPRSRRPRATTREQN